MRALSKIMKKKYLYPLIAGCIYALLLILLTLCERVQPGASITSLADAFWFSIVTLTTVGYGDLYPITAVGRLIGLIFIIMSAGVVAAVVLVIVSAFRSKLLPFLRLRNLRDKDCCLFAAINEASVTLARDLCQQDPGCVPVFCGTPEEYLNSPAGLDEGRAGSVRMHFFAEQVGTLARKFFEGKGKHKVFLFTGNLSDDYRAAKELEDLPVSVYCMGPQTMVLPKASFFDPNEGCARVYWKRNPLERKEESILLIGSGPAAHAILNQALVSQCRFPFASSTYHLFGDWSSYRELYPAMIREFEAGSAQHGDRIIFHEGSWSHDCDLLEKTADRIIICGEDFSENAELAFKLTRHFAVRAGLFVRTSGIPVPGISFGGAREIFTVENVLHSALDRQAINQHNTYCRSVGDTTSWDDLPPFLKDSNRAAADHLLTKIRILLADNPPQRPDPESCVKAADIWDAVSDRTPMRKNEHERWMRFHYVHNWRYGKVKDRALRTHPSLVPFEDLSEKVQALDDDAWSVIRAFGASEHNPEE